MKICWNGRMVNEVTERLVLSYPFIHPSLLGLAGGLPKYAHTIRDISCPAAQPVKAWNQLRSYLLKNISAEPQKLHERTLIDPNHEATL